MRGDPEDDRGSVAIELVAGVGFLLLPVALLVLSLPAWAQTHTMARTAAREAARTVVVAHDPSRPEAAAAGRRAAELVAANHGGALVAGPVFAWDRVDVGGDGEPLVQDHVEATVTVRVPALAVPLLGEFGGFDWTVAHREPLDIYRSRP